MNLQELLSGIEIVGRGGMLPESVSGVSYDSRKTKPGDLFVAVSGFAADRLGDRKMIRLGTGVLFCGIAALALPIHSHTAAIAAFVVMGLGCAPIYPCIIHSTPANFGAESSGAIIGIQMAGAYVGSTFAPPLFGLLGSALGFSILPAYLLVFAVFMIAMTELTFRTAEKNRSDTGP